MKRVSVAVAAAMVMGAAPAAKDPPPIANYWMDVATTSGMGAGMSPGGRPNMGQIMQMMSGAGSSVGHTLDLRLASRTKAPASPEADHLIPAGLQMGPSLPLIAPVREASSPMPAEFQRPKGRMLIYWGCGEHVTPGQPTIIDFSKLAAGQVPPGMAGFASMGHVVSGPTSGPGFGRWPNEKDRRPVPAGGSLIGAHKVEANYAPQITFSLAGAGQDFMGPLNLAETGALPSGATRLQWQLVPNATGYALALFGAAGNGDVIVWSSANKAAMTTLDYLAPGEVRRLIGTGNVLPPNADQCLLPAEVAAAVPAGMVMAIGYGPEASFADKPRAPTWTTRVRYKTTASLMHGLGGMMGGGTLGQEAPEQQPQPGQEPPKKKKKFGIGDLLGGAIPVPH